MNGELDNSYNLDVHFETKGGMLLIPYIVKNLTIHDVYILDLYSRIDNVTREACIDDTVALVKYLGDYKVRILRGVHPMPARIPIARRIMPLGTKIRPTSHINRTFALPLPLVEKTCYGSSERVGTYVNRAVKTIEFSVHILPSCADGFGVDTCSFTNDACFVHSNNTVGDLVKVTKKVAVEGINISIQKN